MGETPRTLEESTDKRYVATTYGNDDGRVTLLQDTQNRRAWIQSDYTMEVSR
jgi:hypothetical protein